MAARDLLCYWCAVELGISMAEPARRLDLTLAAVTYAVRRGETKAKEGGGAWMEHNEHWVRRSYV